MDHKVSLKKTGWLLASFACTALLSLVFAQFIDKFGQSTILKFIFGSIYLAMIFVLGIVVYRKVARRYASDSFALMVFIAIVCVGLIPWMNLHSLDGDQPHYMVIAQSMVQDGDLDLANNYDFEQYSWFYPEKIDPHVVDRGGHQFPAHWVGMSLFLLPAVFLKSRFIASLTMACLAIAAFCCQVRILDKIAPKLSSKYAVLFSMITPALIYSGLIFPEVVVFCILSYLILLYLIANSSSAHGSLVCLFASMLIAFMPFMKINYSILSLGFFILFMNKSTWKNRLLISGVCIAGALLYVLIHVPMYGSIFPESHTSNNFFSISHFPWSLFQSAFSFSQGCLWFFPVLYLLFRMILSDWSSFDAVVNNAVIVLYMLTISIFINPVAGWCPPGRFFVALLPLVFMASLQKIPSVMGTKVFKFFAIISFMHSLLFVWVNRFAYPFENRPYFISIMSRIPGFDSAFSGIESYLRLTTTLPPEPTTITDGVFLAVWYVILVAVLEFSYALMKKQASKSIPPKILLR